MTKVKSNALWNNLTCDQCNVLDKWFFEEKQGYREVWRRAQTQFKYQGSESSMRRYYNRRRKERVVEEFKDVRDEVEAVSGAPADPDAVRKASMKVLVTVLFQQLRRSPENLKEMVSLAKLIVQNDYNELLREAKAQEFDLRREGYDLRRELKAGDQRIRREAIEFGKEKFRYDMIENAVKALPELQKVVEAMGEADSTRYRESTNKVKQIMFAPPNEHPVPKRAAGAPSPQPSPPMGAREKNWPQGGSEVQGAISLSGHYEPAPGGERSVTNLESNVPLAHSEQERKS